jgi:hypothetical protein
MTSIENVIIKLQGLEQLIIRFSAAEGATDNEMFLLLSDTIREIIGELKGLM